MEQFFTSLSKRQTMLLLTSLAFGGSEAIASFEHLDQAEEELLKHRAQSLLQIPREKRVPLLVQEIKRLVVARRRQLASADPKKLAELLRKERAALTEVVLAALPSELAQAVRAELGNPPRLKLPRDVRPEVLSIIRWKLEDALKSSGPQVGSFRFTDLMTMQQREIFAVADRMGARVLATAVAGLNDADRADFLGKLPPDQRALAAKAAEAGAARRLIEKDARLVLDIHGALDSPSLGMRSAGVQRIVRACYAQSPDFAQRLAQRHQGELGKLLSRWVREEKGKPVKGDGGRLDIVEQFERLAQKGIVDRPVRLPPPMKLPKLAAPEDRFPPPPSRLTSDRAPAREPSVKSPAGRGEPGRPPSGAERGPPPMLKPVAGAPSKVLVPPPVRRQTGAMPSSPPVLRPVGATRDPVAERAARRAGAAGSSPLTAPPARRTDSQVKALRVIRDGKPLERSEAAVDPREAPRKVSMNAPTAMSRKAAKRSGASTNPHRSPVLKGSKRGPDGGSR